MNDKEKAEQLGITVTKVNGKWYATKSMKVITIEESETLAYALGVCRVESGLFWEYESVPTPTP